MMKWIDKIPLVPLAGFAILFAVIPPAAPHLAEKIGMLFDGTLSRPIDIFDLFMHGTPSALLALKLVRMAQQKLNKEQQGRD